jgi:hypothetical protein
MSKQQSALGRGMGGRQRQQGGGWFDDLGAKIRHEFADPSSDLRSKILPKIKHEFVDPNSKLRSQLLPELEKSTADIPGVGQVAAALQKANSTAKELGYGRLPRAKPRWSERTRTKHAFMKLLSKAGVPLAKLARAAAAALAAHERGASMEAAMDTGMKAVGV